MVNRLNAMLDKKKEKAENSTEGMKTMDMETIVGDIKNKTETINKKKKFLNTLIEEQNSILTIDVMTLLNSLGVVTMYKDTTDQQLEQFYEVEREESIQEEALQVIEQGNLGGDLTEDQKKALLVLLALNQKKQRGGATSQKLITRQVDNTSEGSSIFSKETKQKLVELAKKMKSDNINTMYKLLKPVVTPLLDEWCRAPNTNDPTQKLKIILDTLIMYDNVVGKYSVQVDLDFINLFKGIINPSDIDKTLNNAIRQGNDVKLSYIYNENMGGLLKQSNKDTTLQGLKDKLEDLEYEGRQRNNDSRRITADVRDAERSIEQHKKYVSSLNEDITKKMKELQEKQKNKKGIDVDTLIKEPKGGLNKIQEFIQYTGEFEDNKNALVEIDENQKETVYNLLDIEKPTLTFSQVFTRILHSLRTEDPSKFPTITLLFKLLDEFMKFNNTEGYNNLVYYTLVPFLFLFYQINIKEAIKHLHTLKPSKLSSYNENINKIVNLDTSSQAGDGDIIFNKGIISINGTDKSKVANEFQILLNAVDEIYPINDVYTKDLNEESIKTINMNIFIKKKILYMLFYIQKYIIDVFNVQKSFVPKRVKSSVVNFGAKALQKVANGTKILAVSTLVIAGILVLGWSIIHIPLVWPTLLASSYIYGDQAIKNATQEPSELSGGGPINLNTLKIKNIDVATLFDNGALIDKTILKIRNNYTSYGLFSKQFVPEWIQILNEKIPNEYIVYQSLLIFIYDYWIDKYKKDISRLEKINKVQTNYATEKFGEASFTGSLKKAILSLKGIRKKLKEAGLGELIPPILMLTNREVNKNTLKPDAFARITDDNIKIFLYKLETDDKLRKEVVSVDTSLEPKLLEFIKQLKKEDEENKKQKEEIEKKKAEAKAEKKGKDGKKDKEEQKDKQGKGSPGPGGPGPPGPSGPGGPGPSGPSGPPGSGPSGSGPPGTSGPSGSGPPGSGGPGSGPSGPTGPPEPGSPGSGQAGQETPKNETAADQTAQEDSQVQPAAKQSESGSTDKEILKGQVVTEYPPVFTSDVENSYIPSDESMYSPKETGDSIISVNRDFYLKLSQEEERLNKLLKEEKIQNNLEIAALRSKLRTAYDLAQSEIDKMKHIFYQQKSNEKLLDDKAEKLHDEKQGIDKQIDYLNKVKQEIKNLQKNGATTQQRKQKRTQKKRFPKSDKQKVAGRTIKKRRKPLPNNKSQLKKEMKEIKRLIKKEEEKQKQNEVNALKKSIDQIEKEMSSLL